MRTCSATEVDELDVAYGAAEEAGAEALEFFDGVGGEESEDWIRRGRLGWCAEVAAEIHDELVGRGFGGVDDLHPGRNCAFDDRLEEWIVGASEDESVGVHALGDGLGAELFEVDAHDFSRDGRLRCRRLGLRRIRFIGRGRGKPSFFDEGDEKGAGFLEGAKAVGLASGGVGMAVYGGIGGDDEDVSRFGCSVGGLGTRLDDADDGDGRYGFLDVVEGEGTGGVAGDDEVVGALLFDEETRTLSGVAGDGAAGFGAVGQAGSVADEGVVGLR